MGPNLARGPEIDSYDLQVVLVLDIFFPAFQLLTVSAFGSALPQMGEPITWHPLTCVRANQDPRGLQRQDIVVGHFLVEWLLLRGQDGLHSVAGRGRRWANQRQAGDGGPGGQWWGEGQLGAGQGAGGGAHATAGLGTCGGAGNRKSVGGSASCVRILGGGSGAFGSGLGP